MTQHRSEGKGSKHKDPRLDLSVGEVLAATGATVLGTLLVKLLDLWGTVLGTAVLSLFTSVGAVLLLRTMRQTSDRVKLQLAALSAAASTGDGRARETLGEADTDELPSPEEAAEAAETMEKRHSPKRTLIAILVSSVLVFALTIGTLTLLGGITSGDPSRLIIERRITVYETTEVEGDRGGTEPTAPAGPETEPDEPTESEPETSPAEETTEPTSEEPDDETSTEDASEQDEGMDDPEEPTSAEPTGTGSDSPADGE
ncbi:hypothetical protein [Glycomyces xiaoerkulensis]|uniref:hypothetical protein n=1 Tax=Glycomyces xiaoerkulensis TaxID=2038139 RepID=UPI001E54AFC6|nr:hypothetical protein [Glycomyces xiaoerkulensis]